MTEFVRPAPGPLPLARKGEASPASNREARAGPEMPRASRQDLPASLQQREKPFEEDSLATLASLIRHVPRREPERAAELPGLEPTTSLQRSVGPGGPVGTPPADAVEAPPGQQEAGPAVHRTLPGPAALHVPLQVDIHRRRQLTLRLTIVEFARLHVFARMTRSTYQDILASAVQLFLDTITPEGGATQDEAAHKPSAEAHRPHLRLLP